MRYKSPEQLRLEIDTLGELLREAQRQIGKNRSVAVQRKIAYLDHEIEMRRVLLAKLLKDEENPHQA